MTRRLTFLGLTLAMLLASCDAPKDPPTVGTSTVSAAEDDAALVEIEKELDWLEMLPQDELAALQAGEVPEVEHSGDRAMAQFGTFRTVDSVLGRPIRLPGYVVPVESDAEGKLREFLFVPYYGACIHVPPPPPNQIVHVRLPSAIPMPDIYAPFFLAGELVADRTDDDLAGSAYSIRDPQLRPYEP